MAKLIWGKINSHSVVFSKSKTLMNLSFLSSTVYSQFRPYNVFLWFVGSYTAEPVHDFSWALVSMGVLYIIYFVPVQYLAYVSIWKYLAILLIN